MVNTRETLTRQLERNKQKLATRQEEQRKIEAMPAHAGFKDATSRIKAVEDCDSIDESIHKDNDRLTDMTLLP